MTEGVTIYRTAAGDWFVDAPWLSCAIHVDSHYEACSRAGGVITRHRMAHRAGHACCGRYCPFWLPVDEDDHAASARLMAGEA